MPETEAHRAGPREPAEPWVNGAEGRPTPEHRAAGVRGGAWPPIHRGPIRHRRRSVWEWSSVALEAG